MRDTAALSTCRIDEKPVKRRFDIAHCFPARRPRGRRGLTFIELLIALAITSVTCGILAVLINATATGTNTQNDGRRGLVRMQALKSGLQDEFTNVRAILATGPNYVVYWIGDQLGAPTPTNQAVNLSELRMLTVDTATGNLKVWSAQFPDAWTDAMIASTDYVLAANTSWYATCTTLITSSPYAMGTTITTGVTGMTISLDAAAPTAAKLIHFQINLSESGVSRTLVLDVALANALAPY